MNLWCGKLIFKYKNTQSPPNEYKVIQTACIINILRCQLAITVFIFQGIYMALYKKCTMAHVQKSTAIPWYQYLLVTLHSFTVSLPLSHRHVNFTQTDKQHQACAHKMLSITHTHDSHKANVH